MSKRHIFPASQYGVDIIADFITAITDYYGAANVTIHFSDLDNVVFEVPSVFDRVIHLQLTAAHTRFYYGTGWTSGTTLVGSQTIRLQNWAGTTNSNDLYVFLSEKYIAVYSGQYLAGSSASENYMIIMGQTTDGPCVACSFTPALHGTVLGYNTAMRTDTNDLIFVAIGASSVDSKHPDQKYIKIPLIFANRVSKSIIVDSLDAVTTIPDIWLTTLSEEMTTSTDVNVFRPKGQYTTDLFWRCTSTTFQFYGAFLFELDAEV